MLVVFRLRVHVWSFPTLNTFAPFCFRTGDGDAPDNASRMWRRLRSEFMRTELGCFLCAGSPQSVWLMLRLRGVQVKSYQPAICRTCSILCSDSVIPTTANFATWARLSTRGEWPRRYVAVNWSSLEELLICITEVHSLSMTALGMARAQVGRARGVVFLSIGVC